MIRHNITQAALLAKVPQQWKDRAAVKAKTVMKARRVAEGDGIWSEIKSIFMELQGFKCMYCEKPMPKESAAGVAAGKVEYDVEHFRPKNRVTVWPTKAVKKTRGIDYDGQLKPGVPAGYPHLAFDPLNYGVSCKTCNSELKGDRFPITGKRNARSKDRVVLDAMERPCLLLPIGDVGDDPETWLEWLGPTVRARTTPDPDTTLRARTLVDFFELDTRGDLLLARCAVVMMLWNELEQIRLSGDGSATTNAFVDTMIEDTAYFAGCARAFKALFEQNRADADRWRRLAREYAVKKDPGVFG